MVSSARGSSIGRNSNQRWQTSTDRLEQRAGKDVFSLGMVDYAVLETSGELSILLEAAGRQQPGGGSSPGAPARSRSGFAGLLLNLVAGRADVEKRNLTVSRTRRRISATSLRPWDSVRLQQVLYAAVDTVLGTSMVQDGKRIV